MASNATSRWLETTLPSFRISSQISLQIAARKAVRFVAAILLVHVVHASLLLAYAKACPQDEPSAKTDKRVEAIEKVHEDYQEYLKQKQTLVETYQSLQTSLQQTEDEWKRIQNEGVIKQFAAMQSSLNSLQISNSIGSIGSAPGGNNSPNDLAMRQQLQQQLMANRMMENMNAFMRSQELQQLGVEAQRAIQARFATMQKVMKVEEDYRKWQLGGNRFFEKYWNFTDPQKAFSEQEIQTVLQALETDGKDNPPAQLAQALLLTRKGDYSQAKPLLDPIIESPSPLQPIALMCKALVLDGLDKDRDSKLAMQNSIKIDRANPYCRWLRARLACKQDQLNIAETEWKALTTLPTMQQDAKRALALLYAQRVSKTPSNAGRAVALAQEAHQDETPATWFSHYVLAVALHSAKKKDEAIEQVQAAKELASDDLQMRCDALRQAIDDQTPFLGDL
jgi:hypothetical protein